MANQAHVFESRFKVRSYELDGFAHMNHAVFLNWFEQARFGDELVVRSWVEDVARSSMTFHQVASPAGQPDVISAEARVRAVWIGPDRRPARIPPEVRAALGVA
ncbi:MAG: hypothetical protein EXR95_07100 [Gemmatimonadetes bacterium]|nr:hypothetical protein [Gemmatimonadota bacterium]